jgi:hypothetical protein
MPTTPIPHETIAVRAYFLWEDEGRPHGRHNAHWLAAEATEHQARAEAPTLAPAALAPATAVQATEAEAVVLPKPSTKAAAPRKAAAKKAAPAEAATPTAPAETVVAAAALQKTPRAPRTSAKRPGGTH